MSGALGPGSSRVWPTAGHLLDECEARLLVVDPVVARGGVDSPADALTTELAWRGVHVTAVASTIDGLVELGRGHPAAVIVAPDAPGIPPAEFVRAVRRYGTPFVIAVLDQPDGGNAGELIVAGGSAAIERPYTSSDVWNILEGAIPTFHASARLVLGPLELDARAYSVKINGARIQDLPRKEFELLRTLMRRSPDVLDDQEIRRELWGGGQLNGNTVAVHVARLRHRLQGVVRIRRIRGRGYSMALD